MEVEKSCPFCDELKKQKELADYYRKSKLSTTKYTVALVCESYWDGNFTGSLKCCGHTLNFCPSCGNSLPDVNTDVLDNNSKEN